MLAAENGMLEKARHLLERDPSLVQVTDKDGYTPLHRACYNNHPQLVDLLLQYGADIHAQTEMGWQPLHSCCQWNHVECAVRLIQNGADVNAVSNGGKH